MSEQDEPQYIYLNYCMVDQETGYCLTCGRPPLPPPSLDFSQPASEPQENTAPVVPPIPGSSGN